VIFLLILSDSLQTQLQSNFKAILDSVLSKIRHNTNNKQKGFKIAEKAF